jgi:hypothetical protein
MTKEKIKRSVSKGKSLYSFSQKTGLSIKHLYPSFKTLIFIAGCLLAIAAGCESSRKKSPDEKIRLLKQQNSQLQDQIKEAMEKNTQLQKRLNTLTAIKSQHRLDDIYNLKKVNIGGFTNISDKDKDSLYEKLIVYIQPLDTDGDIIKAIGSVEVQLWNLEKPQNQAMLGHWHVDADELRKFWISSFISTNYRLIFDLPEKIGQTDEPLTVRLIFIDYLTGKTFKQQKQIKPML